MKFVLGTILGFLLTGFSIGFSDEFIAWSEDRKLTWDDFSGMPGVFPENYDGGDSRTKAFTWGESKLLAYDFERAPSIICQYQITKIELQGMFNRNQSWVKKEIRNDPSVLNHEQGHFDILEVIVRKTESALLLKMFECPNGIYDEPLIHNDLRKIVSDYTIENQKMHQQYDEDTSTGNKLSPQEQWDGKIKLELWRYDKPTTDYSKPEKARPEITYGLGRESVTCEIGFVPIEKLATGKLFCVTPATSFELEERGWGKFVNTGREYLDP